MAKLQIDDSTEIAIETSYGPEGQIAGLTDDAKVRLEDLINEAEKIATKVREGLTKLGPTEVGLELGFTAGKNIWILSAQGSITLKMKWATK